eukprot:3005674-Prymnesium_polylepis.1
MEGRGAPVAGSKEWGATGRVALPRRFGQLGRTLWLQLQLLDALPIDAEHSVEPLQAIDRFT